MRALRRIIAAAVGPTLAVILIGSMPVAGQGVERAAEVPALTEGPTVDADGNVYFTDILNERIYRLGADHKLTVFRERSNGANGLVIDPQGRLIVCEGFSVEHPAPARITRTDLRTGAVELLADGAQGTPFMAPNDVTLDHHGRIFFTAASAVYRIDAPGQVVQVLGAPDVVRPNGLQIAPDDGTLYVSESAIPAGPRVIRAFDLRLDGTAHNGRIIFEFDGFGAGGMSVDVEGNLYVAAGLNALVSPGFLDITRTWPPEALLTRAGVYVISPKGALLRLIPIPEDAPTNTSFGGSDMRTLYVTAGRTLFQVRTEIAGLPR